MPNPNVPPRAFTWNYDRAELVADGIVHSVGVVLAVIGAVALAIVSRAAPSVLVYAAGLVAALGISAAYNMWPVSPRKWLLRRFDHSAIYLLIAATYTPFVVEMRTGTAVALLVFIWCVAIVGILMKLLLPGRFDRLSIALYLFLGWSGVMIFRPVVAVLPATTLWLLAAGGLLYTAGVAFHVWKGLRFHNVIWHGFVLAAALCHYSALFALTLSES
jgi:hemolysin III